MNKLLVITGPTASGKTAFALEVAQKLNGQLINADSRQIYTGMDVVTGKEMDRSSKFIESDLKWNDLRNHDIRMGYYLVNSVPVWLLDICKPDIPFYVSLYRKLVYSVILILYSKQALPILVGGSGQYIKEVLFPSELSDIPRDTSLRKKLEELNLHRLIKEASFKFPQRWNQMNHSDQYNPRRLIRMIETESYLKNNETDEKTIKPFSETLVIGLTLEKNLLYARIKKRVADRLKTGALDETKKLFSVYSADLPAFSACGYRLLKEYLSLPETKQREEELIRKWTQSEFHYGVRQLRYLKKIPGIIWTDSEKDYDKALVNITRWYNK